MSADILGTSSDQCRSMVQYSFTSTETRKLVRTDSPGQPPRLSHSSWTMKVWEEGGREIIYLHCHHQSDSCIKMSSDESHFNVSLIVRDKVTRQCPQTTTFSKRAERWSGIEPRSFCLPARPLGQTGSQRPLPSFQRCFTPPPSFPCLSQSYCPL